MFEDDLTRTLHAAADATPLEDLLRGVEALRRRRRSRRLLQSALAAVAVIALVATVTGLVRQAVSAPLPATTPSPSPTELVPAEAVWPQAVVRVPARTADGLVYSALAAVDAQRVLLLAERARWDGDHPARFAVFDAATGQITLVTELPEDAKVGTVRVNDRHLVWDASGGLFGAKPELWTVPLSGGVPSKVTEAVWFSFEVVGDDLVWDDKEGVHRMPLAGGEAQIVPGGEKRTLLDWPWAVPYTEGWVTSTDQEPVAKVEARNLETGETRQLDWGGQGPVYAWATGCYAFCIGGSCGGALCSADWCVTGGLAGPGDGSLVTPSPLPSEPFAVVSATPESLVQPYALLQPRAEQTSTAHRHDGAQTVEIPGAVLEPPALNRFVVVAFSNLVVDLATGTKAVFEPVRGTSPSAARGRTLVEGAVIGDELMVLNLKAIP